MGFGSGEAPYDNATTEEWASIAMCALVAVSVTFAGTKTTCSRRLRACGCGAILCVALGVMCYYIAGCGSLDCGSHGQCYRGHCDCYLGYGYSDDARTCVREINCAHGYHHSGRCVCHFSYIGTHCEFPSTYVITGAKDSRLNGVYRAYSMSEHTCEQKPVYHMDDVRLYQPSGHTTWTVSDVDAASSCRNSGFAFSRTPCSEGPGTCASWKENTCVGGLRFCISPMQVTARGY